MRDAWGPRIRSDSVVHVAITSGRTAIRAAVAGDVLMIQELAVR